MNSILANNEATGDGYDEALLLDPKATPAKAPARTCLHRQERQAATPDLTACLEGITRATVMQLAGELGIEVIEKRITRDEVYCADEAFFTGTAAEVTPIRELDNRPDRRRPPRPDHKALQENTSTWSMAAAGPRRLAGLRLNQGEPRCPTTKTVEITAHDLPLHCPDAQRPALVPAPARLPRRAEDRRSNLPVLQHQVRLQGRSPKGHHLLIRWRVADPP